MTVAIQVGLSNEVRTQEANIACGERTVDTFLRSDSSSVFSAYVSQPGQAEQITGVLPSRYRRINSVAPSNNES